MLYYWQMAYFTCTDPVQRFSGVAVCISDKLRNTDDLRFASHVPGRLLHVRCLGTEICIDIVGMHQWAWNTQKISATEHRRQNVWTASGRLFSQLPSRNVLIFCSDANTPVYPSDGYIGRGILKSSDHAQTDIDDFAQLIRANDLCLLNTWRSSRSAIAATYHGYDSSSQIDFVATRRNNVDAISKCAKVLPLDLTPWRQGTKHRPVVCSIQVRGCWCKKASMQRKQMYNRRELEHSITQYDDRAMQLQEKITHALANMHDGAEPGAINQILHDVCLEIYPISRDNGSGTKNAKAWQTLNVKHTLAGIWSAYKIMRSTARTRLPMRPGLGRLFRAWQEALRSTRLSRSSKAMARKRRIGLQLTFARMFNVWKCYLQFYRSHRVFRKAGKSGKRQIMLDKLAKAEDAANHHQPGELY